MKKKKKNISRGTQFKWWQTVFLKKYLNKKRLGILYLVDLMVHLSWNDARNCFLSWCIKNPIEIKFQNGNFFNRNTRTMLEMQQLVISSTLLNNVYDYILKCIAQNLLVLYCTLIIVASDFFFIRPMDYWPVK